MRPTCLTLLCVVIVATAAARASAAPDAVDQLLYGDSPVVLDKSISESHVPQPASNVSTEAPSSANESSGFSQQAPWNAPVDSGMEIGRVRDVPMAQADGEELPPASRVTAVPEPSAIFLALAALVYFLLFGRRRIV
jgi:hypothetical protein